MISDSDIRPNSVLGAAVAVWLAAVLLSYYWFSAEYYAEKLRVFSAFIMRFAS